MLRILFVETDPRRGSVRRRISGLSAGLQGLGCQTRSVELRPTSLDIRPWLKLRQTLRDFAPDIVHTAGSPPGRWTRWLLGGGVHFDTPLPAFGYRTGAVSLTMEEARRRLRVPVDIPLILCIGRLEAESALKDAIWAFDILRYLMPSAFLLIAGEGPHRAELEEFANRIETRNHVKFLGWWNDVETLVTAADILWIPGRHRDTPLAAVEAMAAGKPVVAARCPAAEAIIEDGSTGLLYPAGEKPTLSQLTFRLLENEDWRRRLGGHGRIVANARFGLPDVAARLYQDYRNTLAARADGSAALARA